MLWLQESAIKTAKAIPLLLQILLNFTNLAQCLEAPQINIPGQGVLVGTYMKMFRAQNIKAYLGIKYAQAPRFAPPEVDTTDWRGVRNATAFAPNCWQKSAPPENEFVQMLLRNRLTNDGSSSYNEDCLYLNVFVPDGAPGINGYAVVVWIHGGDFSYGAPTDIEPFQLVFKQKVIVVTFSYRLNIFGFLTSGDGESQGNYGLMDQSAALFWIRKNINNFGGDENKITIMGHSAGAISVGLHLTSEEWSKDGFSRAIMMSGNPLSENAVRHPRDYNTALDIIGNIFGCNRRPTSKLLYCLRKVDPKTLSENIPTMEWGPVVDYGLSNTSSHFIKDFPRVLFKNGNFQKVPTMIGVTDMEDVLSLIDDVTNTKLTDQEFSRMIEDISKNDLKMSADNDENCTNTEIISDALNYMYQSQGSNGINIANKFVSFHTDRNYIAPMYFLSDILSSDNMVFAYLFTMRPQTKFYNFPEWINVPKLFDQIFVWGIPYMNNTNMVKEWNSSDKRVSDVVMTMWANFAKSANPTISNVYVKWNPYSIENKSLLAINQNFNSDTVNNMFVIRFWNDYYPSIVKFAVNCCEAANVATPTHHLLNPGSTQGLFLHIFANIGAIWLIYYALLCFQSF